MKYEYIGDQSITIHGNGESGTHMSEIELPKLPKLPPIFKKGTIGADVAQEYAREYARAAVLAERERCARVCEDMHDPQDDGWEACLNEVAAAIRRGSV